MIRILSLVDRFIRAMARKILYPKLNSNYYYLTRNKIYRAPSLRQISIFRQFAKVEWNPSNFWTVKKVLEIVSVNNPVILDIGANIGYYAIVYSKLLNKYGGRCISFEPALVNISAFLYNTQNLHNTRLFKFGLGAVSEYIKLGIPQIYKSSNKDIENTGLLSACLVHNDDSAVYKSRVFPLDSIEDGIINKEEHIVYVKIDVEGYELNVIRGMTETIRKHMPVIQIEFNSKTLSLEDRKEILKTLYRFSYVTFSNKPFNIIEDNEIFFVDSKNYTLVKIYSQSAELSEFHFIE
jgi:FkbM family methyltransferase